MSHYRNKGFTLIELLIVMGVLTILLIGFLVGLFFISSWIYNSSKISQNNSPQVNISTTNPSIEPEILLV